MFFFGGRWQVHQRFHLDDLVVWMFKHFQHPNVQEPSLPELVTRWKAMSDEACEPLV